MDEQQWRKQIQTIREQLAALRRYTVRLLTQHKTDEAEVVTSEMAEAYEAIATAMDHLVVLQEEMYSKLEQMIALEEHLLQQTKQLAAVCQRDRDRDTIVSEEQFRQHIQAIHQQMAVLHQYMMQLSQPQQQQVAGVLAEIAADLGNLHLIFEEMQSTVEAVAVVEEGLLEQHQQAIAEHQHYYDLFQFSPDAYLVTDGNGLILEANRAIAKLLNVPQSHLADKPLAVFVVEADRQAFRTWLNQLSQVSDVHNWEMSLCPRNGEPFVAQLNVAIVRDDSGYIEALRIGVHDISRYKQAVAQPAQLLDREDAQAQTTAPALSLPQALDGLQVLIVDDEADAREFITAVLESHGIRVTAVGSAAEALKALERFHPDVLMSDIRMPDENGYSLIRRIRELEAEKGWHIPAAALTAYLAEDREKALAAGFESHLHKLAQPTELVEMVARLAGRV